MNFSETKFFHISEPFKLDNGGLLFPPVTVAYETYGRLNEKRDNAVLICHALSGSANAAFYHKNSKKPGWWDFLIGKGKPINTDKYFVICSNVLGGCYGSTGPLSVNPETGKHYGLEFPVITIRDMVNAQSKLIEYFQIPKLHCVVGGSMGGMQVLEWCVSFPEKVNAAIAIATTSKHNAIQIAFNEVGRHALMSDPNWNYGNYYNREKQPDIGLSIARMIAHITYLSEKTMNLKFGRALKEKEKSGYDFTVDFEVGSYLHYQGVNFTKRFDANCYLYITKAIDYFNISERFDSLEDAFSIAREINFLIISFTSDWLYPAEQSQVIAKSLSAAGANVSYINLDCEYGHDSFLIETESFKNSIKHFLQSLYF